MSQVAKVFKNGRSQAGRLPAAFRFDAERRGKPFGAFDLTISARLGANRHREARSAVAIQRP